MKTTTDTLLCRRGTETLVRLRAPDWRFDPDELRRAFSSRTKAIIVNTPNNPTGKVFSLEELTLIANLCQEFDALVITDEIYEHITYDGALHVPIITLPGMRHRSILVNSMSKTFSVTGWRVGWVAAAPELTGTIRKVHDFLTVGAATPLQQAGFMSLNLPDRLTPTDSRAEWHAGRRRLPSPMLLGQIGFRCFRPSGAYYVMADISAFGMSGVIFAEDTLWNVMRSNSVPGGSSFLFADLRTGAHKYASVFVRNMRPLRQRDKSSPGFRADENSKERRYAA